MSVSPSTREAWMQPGDWAKLSFTLIKEYLGSWDPFLTTWFPFFAWLETAGEKTRQWNKAFWEEIYYNVLIVCLLKYACKKNIGAPKSDALSDVFAKRSKHIPRKRESHGSLSYDLVLLGDIRRRHLVVHLSQGRFLNEIIYGKSTYNSSLLAALFDSSGIDWGVNRMSVSFRMPHIYF